MKNSIFLYLSLCIFMIGCGDSQPGSDSGESGLGAAVPDSLPADTKLSINPTITLQSELSNGRSGSAYYINDDPSYFWVGEGVVDITLDRTSTSIVLSFTTKDGNKVEFEMTNFVDIGQDGFIDEFTVVGKVNGETKVNQVGQFRGNTRPRNINVKDTIDINRAPTQKEFEDNIVGMLLVHVEKYPDKGDGGIDRFNADGTLTTYDLNGNWFEEGIGTYRYNYNNGDPRFIVEATDTETIPSLGEVRVDEKYIIKLNFSNLYEGTYETLESSYTYNGQTFYEDDDNLSRGDFFIMTTVPSP